MKKIISSVLIVFVLFSAIPNISLAAQPGGSNVGGITNPLGPNGKDLPTFMASLLRVAFLIGTMVAVFFIIYAGFLYVTAGGDPGKIKTAHSTLLYAAIGTAILLGAQVIADVIKNTVTQLAS